MSEKAQLPSLTIRRILVALDSSEHSQAALQAAADMAALLDAKLVGLFVEDINLLHVAQLSFVNEVRFPRAEVRSFDQADMEQHWRAQAVQVRYELATIARFKQIPYSFKIVRGPVAAHLLRAALDADLLALGRLGRSLPGRARLGSTAQMAVFQASGAVLLAHAGIDLQQPVVLIYDGTPEANRALVFAADLARLNGRLRVLVWTEDDETASKFRQEIIAQVQVAEIEISFRRVHPGEQDQLRAMVENNAFGLFVIGSSLSQLPSPILQTLLDECDYPILIVR